MTSRLRRMVLVNVRSSGTLTSGAINELDPRDGAAIVGDNAVGKTTTLKLLPLFFGTPPSQIDQPGSGRVPMLRFVLPETACALVFEYQRGDQAEDVRCVVMRRQEGSDAPEYRFMDGPYKRDYFVGSLGDGGADVFLDDAGMQEAAEKLGVTPERKLNSAQYRAVILNLRPTTHDASMLRRLASRYSFAQRGLANLDRLIAAVVKERIDFKDFTNVAVAMAQAPQGQMGAAKSEPERISLRQKKGQIDIWIRNRESCASAIALTPKVADLRAELDKVVREEGVLSQRQADVDMLIVERQMDARKAAEEHEKLKSESERLRKEEDEHQAQLVQTTSTAASEYAEVERHYLSMKAQADRFEKQDAAGWATKVVELPSLRNELSSLTKQSEAALGEAQTIEARYSVLVSQTREASGTAISLWQAEKQARQVALQARLVEVANDERAELVLVDKKSDETKIEQQEVMNDLSREEGKLEAAALNPSVDVSLDDEIEKADNVLSEANDTLAKAVRHQGEAVAAFDEAQLSFGRAELGIVGARELAMSARAGLEDAKLLLAPKDGTLLSALRASGDDEWRSNLAKILNPALLRETGMNARLAEEEDGSSGAHAFGWSLELGSIRSPDWTDDAAMRDAVRSCEVVLERAQNAEQGAIATRDTAGKRRADADSARTAASADHRVAETRAKSLKLALDAAKDRKKAAIRGARGKAEEQLRELKLQIKSQRKRNENELSSMAGVRKDVEQEFARRAMEAQAECTRDLMVLDGAIADHVLKTNAQVNAILAQREEELSGKGVDLVRLKGLQDRIAKIGAEVAKLEGQVNLVNEWRAWMDGGGTDQLLTAFLAESNANKAWLKAKTAAETQLTATAGLRRLRGAGIERAASWQTSVETETDQLRKLRDRFTHTTARLGSGIGRETGYLEIKGLVEAQERTVRSSEEAISRLFRDVTFELTRREGAVKDLIDAELASLSGESSERRRAHEVCIVHGGIATQIVTQVNQELMLVLENITQFRKQIEDFESEIDRFNKKLRQGLKDVARFERLKEIELNVVTDFGRLGFMDKIKQLDETYNDHKMRQQASAGINTALPPETASQALRQLSLVLGAGSMEVELAQHVTLSGSVNENGNVRHFARDSELQNISSTGLSALIIITLLSGMVNVIRGTDPVYLPWCTDEIGKFDASNFSRLMEMLQDNRIDVVTASPMLTPVQSRQFGRRYIFGERGSIGGYKPLETEAEVV